MALKNYQISRPFTAWKSEIEKRNHVSTMFHSAPQKASNVMVELLARNYAKYNSTVDSFPTKEFDSDDEYTWDVIGSSRRNIPLIEARALDGHVIDGTTGYTFAGVGGEEFYLVFGEDWFFNQEIIHGSLNEKYPLLIKGKPRYEGTNVVYTVELANGSQLGVPSERLQLGERFSYSHAVVSRGLSRKVGGVRHAAPTSMRNEWTTIRLGHEVSGDLLDKKIAFGVPMVKEVNGKMVKSTEPLWMHYVDFEFQKTWTEYKNNCLTYGTSNRDANGEYHNFDASGEVIRMGDNLHAQMERGNIIPYNKFSLKFLEEILTGFSAGKLDISDRKFLVTTGEFGALEFNRAAKSAMSGWTEFDYNGENIGVVTKNGDGYTLKNIQFTKYIAPNGIEVSVKIDPMKDDPVRNKITHPNGGVAESYTFDIFDMGTAEQANIFKCQLKGKPEYYGFMSGMRNPYNGSYNNPYMSYEDDKASMHRMATLGVCILDPTRTMRLVPSLLR
jgi:hypothetical protein